MLNKYGLINMVLYHGTLYLCMNHIHKHMMKITREFVYVKFEI